MIGRIGYDLVKGACQLLWRYWPLVAVWFAWNAADAGWHRVVAAHPDGVLVPLPLFPFTVPQSTFVAVQPTVALLGPLLLMVLAVVLEQGKLIGRPLALAVVYGLLAAALLTGWPEAVRLWPFLGDSQYSLAEVVGAFRPSYWMPMAAGTLASYAGWCLATRAPGLGELGAEPKPKRAASDNHGHADWLDTKGARALFPRPHPEYGGLVVGEAYRVDEDPVARRCRFKPADPRTWGQGGKAPLLIDPCLEAATHALVFAGAGGAAGQGGEARGALRGEQELLEEADRLRRRLHQAHRLRLKRQGDPAARPVLKCCEVGHVPEQRLGDGLPRINAGRGAERAGDGADAARQARLVVGQQRRQQASQAVGVGKPLRRPPVGGIDLLLDPLAMERPIREAVDGEDIKLLAGQELAQCAKLGRGVQRLRGDGGQPKPDAHGSLRRNPALHLRQMPPQCGKDIRPAFAAVNVGAISEVRRAGWEKQPHDRGGRPAFGRSKTTAIPTSHPLPMVQAENSNDRLCIRIITESIELHYNK